MGAPGPHDFAVRVCAARLSAHLTSTAFRSTFVTIAIRPFCRRGTTQANINFCKTEREIFLHEGLDNPNQLEPKSEIRFFAHAVFAGSGSARCEPTYENLLDSPVGQINSAREDIVERNSESVLRRARRVPDYASTFSSRELRRTGRWSALPPERFGSLTHKRHGRSSIELLTDGQLCHLRCRISTGVRGRADEAARVHRVGRAAPAG